MHFNVNVQLFTGDLPSRSKCNQFVNHNGFYACTKCLLPGSRCTQPCGHHTLYKFIDFITVPPPRRSQKDINTQAQQAIHIGDKFMGVLGVSPFSSIMSIPTQSAFDYMHLVLEIHFR